MTKFILLLFMFMPGLTFAKTTDVTDNIQTLECGFHGWIGQNHLKLSTNSFIDPRGEEHLQRKVALIVTGIYFDDRYDYLLKSVIYDDVTNTYTVSLFSSDNQYKSIVVKVESHDIQEMPVIKHDLPHSHAGRCIITGS